VRAWEHGGAAGLDVLERPWTPSKPELARAEAALAAWEDAPELVVSRNRWTLVGRGAQLRYGRDGRWYPYREDAGEWWPAGPTAIQPPPWVASEPGRPARRCSPGAS
jgi:hypothetical protein